MEEADRRLDEQVFELATQINLQTQQIQFQGTFIGCLENQIVDYHKMMKEKNKDHSEALDKQGNLIYQWRDWSSKQTGEKEKLWNKIGLLEEALEEAKKQNKDNMSVMRQMILDVETKNEKSKTSGCFSGIMNWCR